jgi:hypothetical protein
VASLPSKTIVLTSSMMPQDSSASNRVINDEIKKRVQKKVNAPSWVFATWM